jgi:O-antigen ligase
MVFQKQHRTVLALLSGILGLAVILTWSRNLWLADILVFGVLLLLLPRVRRRQVIRAMLILAVVLVVGVWFLTQVTASTAEADLMDTLAERATEFFRQENVTDLGTVSGRLFEMQLAVQHIAQHPLLGIGLGNSYYEEPNMIWVNPSPEKSAYFPMFIHNGFFWIAMKMGLIAIGLYLAIIVVVLRLAYRVFRRGATAVQRGLAAGLGLAFLGMMISAGVMPVVMQAPTVVTISVLMGLLVVLAREESPSPGRSSLPGSPGASGRQIAARALGSQGDELADTGSTAR